MNIRPERRIELDNKEIYIDIFLQDDRKNMALIELKYKTREVEIEIDHERFRLKNQSANDVGRYDFMKDLSRLEECVEKLPKAVGYAIFLTNDPLYWVSPRKRDTYDKDFRIHDGRVIPESKKALRWGREQVKEPWRAEKIQ